MRKLMVPPHPVLIAWRNEELAKGNRAKAIKIQRVMEKKKYIDVETGLCIEGVGGH